MSRIYVPKKQRHDRILRLNDEEAARKFRKLLRSTRG